MSELSGRWLTFAEFLAKFETDETFFQTWEEFIRSNKDITKRFEHGILTTLAHNPNHRLAVRMNISTLERIPATWYLEIMSQNGNIARNNKCPKCNSVMKVSQFKTGNSESDTKLLWECTNEKKKFAPKRCRKKLSLLHLSWWSGSKISIKNWTKFLFKIFNNTMLRNGDFAADFKISEKVVGEYVKFIVGCVDGFWKENRIKAEGQIQVDITDVKICKQTVKVMTIIGESNSTYNWFKLENSTEDEYTRKMKPTIVAGSNVKTDGDFSFNGAVRACGCTQDIVNHNDGFTNAQGNHTNRAESSFNVLKNTKFKRMLQRVKTIEELQPTLNFCSWYYTLTRNVEYHRYLEPLHFFLAHLTQHDNFFGSDEDDDDDRE